MEEEQIDSIPSKFYNVAFFCSFRQKMSNILLIVLEPFLNVKFKCKIYMCIACGSTWYLCVSATGFLISAGDAQKIFPGPTTHGWVLDDCQCL